MPPDSAIKERELEERAADRCSLKISGMKLILADFAGLCVSFCKLN
jgi:hypothetical protein